MVSHKESSTRICRFLECKTWILQERRLAMRERIGVEIVDLAPVNSELPHHFYNLYSIEDCETEFDIGIWDLVMSFDDVVTIGMSIGIPIYGCNID